MAKEGKHAADPQLLLALACGASAESAAGKAGVSESTVRRRLRDPGFRRKLDKLRASMHVRIADQLTASGTEAVRTLVQLLQSSNPANVRLGAARSVVELGAKMRETADLATRLHELEQRFEDQKGKAR